MTFEIDDAVVREGIALGVERAIGPNVRAEVRAFLEDYFGCLSKPEIAGFFGVSERTVEALWASGDMPKDTALGSQLPRAWLPAMKEMLAASRLKARASGGKPKLALVPKRQAA